MSIEIEMVTIPAGKFLMGDDKHEVELPEYQIGKYPVTVAQYRQFCEATGREMPHAPIWGWINEHPIVNVSWFDATAFCEWAGVRLPTEAQWEKAARGTHGRLYPWGNEWDKSKCANYTNSKSTQPVGSYPDGASPYGVLDMAGNVWEWLGDTYSETDRFRVLRGGSWHFLNPFLFRSAYRFRLAPGNWLYFFGFRGACG